MKKLVTLLMGAMAGMTAFAQSTFFEYTSYVGAFAPAPTARWTDSWTNWDAQNANYGTPTVTISSNITSNTTWTSNNVYLLNNAFIYVDSGAVLTIEPGTVIRGTGIACLVVERGAKIIAQGTANQPIVFTSNAPTGSRDYGDWGGVVINGYAKNNLASFPNSPDEGGIGDVVAGVGLHGGNNDDDSSGVLSYVRIEFAGIPLGGSNSEINGLSMYSVGRKTKIDHIQVTQSGDDSFEWFGGTVDCKYLVAFHGWDDDFDTDNGYRGRVQFALSIRDSRYADQSGSNGFESDNDANGTTRQPKTRAQFSNVTIIGPNFDGNADTTNSLYRRGAHLRRNTGISIYNSIITGYPSAGFLLDGRKTSANYCGDTLQLCGNILAKINTPYYYRLSSADTLCVTSASQFMTVADGDNNDTVTTTAGLNLGTCFGNSLTDYDARPTASSIAVTKGSCWAWNTTFVGVEETEVNDNFMMYPNPASTMVTVSFNASAKADATVTLYDLTGKAVSVIPVNLVNSGANQFTFDVSQLSKGIYMLSIQSAAFSKVEKIIVH